MRNQGRCFATGSSSPSLPASRCCITAMLLNSQEIEQIEYIVSAVAATFGSSIRFPRQGRRQQEQRGDCAQHRWVIPG